MKAILNGAFERIELGGTKVTIGRAGTNQLVLNSSQVSAYHAEIHPEGSGYSILDLGSTNGTFLNNYRLVPHVPRSLKQNDKLRFGQDLTDSGTTFTYEVMGVAPVEPTYAVQSPLPAYSSSPQYGYQPQLPPSSPTYPPSQQEKRKKEDEKEGKWSWRDWLVKVVIPLLTIMATAGFFTAKAVGPSIPQLHQTYSGHITTASATATLFITGVHETSEGDFTATGTDPCPLAVDNGKVGTDNSISFELKETPVAGTPCGAVGEYHGTIRSDGSMAGTWDVPNTQIQGSWDLS